MVGIRTETDHRDVGPKAQLKRADGMHTRLAFMIGDDELATRRFVLRDLSSREQRKSPTTKSKRKCVS